jgi:hypothetical protein
MPRFLVTVAVGGAYDAGPAVIIEAEDRFAAAREGAIALLQNDGGYGVQCRECEGLTISELVVFDMDDGHHFGRSSEWERLVEAPAET